MTVIIKLTICCLTHSSADKISLPRDSVLSCGSSSVQSLLTLRNFGGRVTGVGSSLMTSQRRRQPGIGRLMGFRSTEIGCWSSIIANIYTTNHYTQTRTILYRSGCLICESCLATPGPCILSADKCTLYILQKLDVLIFDLRWLKHLSDTHLLSKMYQFAPTQ